LDVSKKRDLTRKHQFEMGSLDELYKKELENLELIYNNKFNELEMKSKQLEDSLNFKHQEEMKKFYASLEEKLPKNVKYSKKYLDLKNMELNLAKQKKYKEAQQIKKKCEEIEIEDTNRFNKEKNDTIRAQSMKNANKQLNERNALKKKLELEYEELKKDKQFQLDVLIHKYKNKKAELENQQKMENVVTENKNLYKASKLISYLNLQKQPLEN